MIRVRFFKNRTNDYAQLLDTASIPDIENAEELYIVARIAGKLIKPYAGSLKDANLVDTLTDETILDWTMNDIQSVQLLLEQDGFQLMITHELGEDLQMTPSQVLYIMVDHSTKFHGVIPEGFTRIKESKDSVDKLAVVDVLQSILAEFTYFSPKKFNQNPIQNYLNMLIEARKVLGTLNSYAMLKLSRTLESLGKRLYAVVKV